MTWFSAIVDVGKRIAGLTRRVGDHDVAIEAMEAKVRDLDSDVHRLEFGFLQLTHVVESLRTEMRYERGAAARGRENMLLHMRNMLLEQGRIPPASPPDYES